MDDDEEVVIIGAGICGLATALALHKKGIKCIVMERAESLRNVAGAAIGIRPNGWRALDQLGIGDNLRHTAVRLKRAREISLDGGKKKELSLVPWDSEARCLRRKDLIDTLYAALPLGTVKFDCQLESIKLDPHSTKPILRFIDGSSIRAKVVIGCDGGKSIIANFLNLKPTKMFPSSAIRGLTNYPNGHSFEHEFARLWKDNILVGIIPVDDNMVYWFCLLPYIPKDEKIWIDPGVIQQVTLELVSDHPQEIRKMIENTDMKSLSITHMRYRAPWDLLTGSFCKGTVTVAGDAMHVMGPFLGQGGSAGLEDSVVLARTMAQLGLNGFESGSKLTVHGVEEAFNRFVKQRRMRVARLSLQTYLTGMLWGTSSFLKKIMYILLLILLFHNQNGHTDYDCGDL
ncbi:putative FAD-binding domain, FAD/NAD(P)-binding domain superfamily [Helianthus annuus]|nr:putative FAD-binding domain, FAD/NAD(P)-binding domain superfamily [Helianthus annuus]